MGGQPGHILRQRAPLTPLLETVTSTTTRELPSASIKRVALKLCSVEIQVTQLSQVYSMLPTQKKPLPHQWLIFKKCPCSTNKSTTLPLMGFLTRSGGPSGIHLMTSLTASLHSRTNLWSLGVSASWSQRHGAVKKTVKPSVVGSSQGFPTLPVVYRSRSSLLELFPLLAFPLQYFLPHHLYESDFFICLNIKSPNSKFNSTLSPKSWYYSCVAVRFD